MRLLGQMVNSLGRGSVWGGSLTAQSLSSPPTPTSTPLLPRTTCYLENCLSRSLLWDEGSSQRANFNSSSISPWLYYPSWRLHPRDLDKHPSSWWVQLQSASSFYTNWLSESISPALPPGVSFALRQIFSGKLAHTWFTSVRSSLTAALTISNFASQTSERQ